jgi:uncharacterized membrane protein
MRSRARALGHPLHSILVMFPTALLPTLLVMDILYAVLRETAFWTVGFWVAAGGIIVTLLAMLPGAMDFLAVPRGTRARRTGMIHALTGVTVLVAFGASLWARWVTGAPPDSIGLVAGIDAIGVLLVGVQGWLGGELVYRHHIGVLAEREGGEPVPLTTSEPGPAGARADAHRRGASRP